MLNWDEPLNPPAPRAPEPVLETVTPSAGPTMMPPLARELPREDRVAEPVAPPPTGATAKPVNPEDKRVVNGLTDINQLAPFKYPWAWE